MAKMTNEYCGTTSGIANNLVYNVHNYVDATNAMAAAINQIKALEDAGDYASATSLAQGYKTAGTIGNCIIDAAAINTIDEEIRNLEIYGKSQQSIFYQEDEPDYVMVEDVWIGA